MPKPCETAARKLPKRCFWTLLKTKKKPASHQAKLKKKVFGTRMRKGRTPAGFVPKPLRNRSRKNAETSLLEPIRKKDIYMPKPCETAARKLPKRCLWNLRKMPNRESAKRCFWNLLKTKKRLPQARQTFAQRKTWKPASHQTKLKKKVFGTRMRKGRTPAGFVPKPLRNRSRKNAETSLKPPGQTQEKGVWDAQQVLCPSHCETVAGKMPKRRCWNPLERRKYMPKPCETAARNSAQTMRNRSQKTAETLLLEPTKNKEKKSPQARQTFAQRKTWKPASHQAKLKKKVFGTRMRKGRTPAGFVPKPLRNRSRKNAETSLLEPIKKRKK